MGITRLAHRRHISISWQLQSLLLLGNSYNHMLKFPKSWIFSVKKNLWTNTLQGIDSDLTFDGILFQAWLKGPIGLFANCIFQIALASPPKRKPGKLLSQTTTTAFSNEKQKFKSTTLPLNSRLPSTKHLSLSACFVTFQ